MHGLRKNIFFKLIVHLIVTIKQLKFIRYLHKPFNFPAHNNNVSMLSWKITRFNLNQIYNRFNLTIHNNVQLFTVIYIPISYVVKHKIPYG